MDTIKTAALPGGRVLELERRDGSGYGTAVFDPATQEYVRVFPARRSQRFAAIEFFFRRLMMRRTQP